jgi:hypothetical protein
MSVSVSTGYNHNHFTCKYFQSTMELVAPCHAEMPLSATGTMKSAYHVVSQHSAGNIFRIWNAIDQSRTSVEDSYTCHSHFPVDFAMLR